MSRPALFLDRDGVINVDHAYVYRPEDFDFMPGIFELVARAGAAGYPVVVVTNQSGIGRGYYGEDDFERLTQWMRARFAERGGRLDAVYHCPHHPRDALEPWRRDCPDRKPAPGMLLRARDALDVDLAHSVLVGDRPSDLEAARRAGVGTRLLFAPETPDADQAAALQADPQARRIRSLQEAAALLETGRS